MYRYIAMVMVMLALMFSTTKSVEAEKSVAEYAIEALERSRREEAMGYPTRRKEHSALWEKYKSGDKGVYNEYHKDCLNGDERWVWCLYGGDGFAKDSDVFIDNQTIEKKGKWNPFADREMDVWFYICNYSHTRKSKAHFLFNLDKKMIQRLDGNNVGESHAITPASEEERLLTILERKYNE